MAALDSSHLYVLGGQIGTELTRKVEAYEAVANVWTPFPAMCRARTKFATCVLGGGTWIYAYAGAMEGGEYHDDTFESCPLLGQGRKWKIIKLQQLLYPGSRVAMTPLDQHSILIYGYRTSRSAEEAEEASYVIEVGATGAVQKIEALPQAIVPATTGYWCPGVAQDGEVLVMSDNSDEPLVYRFRYMTRSWETLPREIEGGEGAVGEE